MRRRIVEIPRHEVGRFRPQAVDRAPRTSAQRLGASLGERAIARQLNRGRHAHVAIVDDQAHERR